MIIHKDEIFEIFKRFKIPIENQCEKKIKILRTDGGGEYTSKQFEEFCAKRGIAHEVTAPYTSQNNGIPERRNISILDMAKCMLKQKGMPNSLWVK